MCHVLELFSIDVFQVESDLDFVTGGENITVLPGKTGRYEMCVKPLRRGHFKGVISFVAAPNPVKYVYLMRGRI